MEQQDYFSGDSRRLSGRCTLNEVMEARNFGISESDKIDIHVLIRYYRQGLGSTLPFSDSKKRIRGFTILAAGCKL